MKKTPKTIKIEDTEYLFEDALNHKEWEVRNEVAKQGYGLDKLVNDKHH